MTADPRRPTVLLIEDDAELGPLIAEGLRDAYAVTVVADGADGLAAASMETFDLVIADRRLPSIDGLTIVRRLRAAGIPTPVLLLTALGTVADRVEGLDAGATDYLVKPFDLAELAARLRAIGRGRTAEQGPVVFIGDWEFRPASRLINSPYEGRRVLTETETQLLSLLARHRTRTLSRKQILREVFPAGDSVGTVDTYVHYIRRKTERDLITTIRGVGYRLGDP